MKINIYLLQTRSVKNNFDFIHSNISTNISIFVDINNLFSKKDAIKYNYYISEHDSHIPTFHHRMSRQIKIIKRIKLLINSLTIHENYIEIELFYQNIEDVVSNYFFYKFKKKHMFVNGNIVEDGLANYHIEILTFKRVISSILKKAYLLLMFFHIYQIPFDFFRRKADLLGFNNKKCKKQFLHFPELSPFHGFNHVISVQLQNKPIKINPIKGRVLILGQETYALPQFLGINMYSKKFNDLYSYIKLKGASEILYKRHNLLQKTGFSISKFTDIIEIENSQPVESILFDINPSIIISFDSSALFYVRLLAIPQIEVYAYPIYYNSFNDLFTKIGVKILTEDDCKKQLQ